MHVRCSASILQGPAKEFFTTCVLPYLKEVGAKRMIAIEPKGDLERKFQAWIDVKEHRQ